ncbi:MAG TPA: 3-deoxy-7-phosphoheptulonate synthase [Ktedonobacterales bacterium]|nr:3-deoxy-7-phosphoheptulonate synthase [Ktedonobacterales bacterium]
MMVVLREGASADERAAVARIFSAHGLDVPVTLPSPVGVVLYSAAPAAEPNAVAAALATLPGVAHVIAEHPPYPLASRALRPEKTIVQVGGAAIGGLAPVIIAGPCAVESEAQVHAAAQAAHAAGAALLRGGAYKPRTSPYTFQGLGLPGMRMLARAGAEFGLPIVTEVMEPGLVPAVAEIADVLQIGSRNMQNFPLLRAAGRSGRPVLLKRGFAATIDEWLLAAEYVLAEGNPNVILCERGVRSFDSQTRNVLDLACVPLLGELTHLPVVVDPSHATGRRKLILPMGLAAIAAGADGLLVEMQPDPDAAISDGPQTIDPATLQRLVHGARCVRAALAEQEYGQGTQVNADMHDAPEEPAEVTR